MSKRVNDRAAAIRILARSIPDNSKPGTDDKVTRTTMTLPDEDIVTLKKIALDCE